MSAINFVSALPQSHVVANFNANDNNTLWITISQSPGVGNPYFSLPLLNDLCTLFQSVKSSGVTWISNGAAQPVHYAVLKSAHPDYFSLGGDLAHFRECIRQQDKKALCDYSMLCADMVYEWSTSLNQQATTIALVQGRALGGGFETALSADLLIAEEHSEFGFPEILFGLFPCTGGMSLLTRRVGVYQAERMMTNGKIYKAAELKEMGVVDELCPKGQGELTVEKIIAIHAKQRTPRLMLQRSRHRVAPLNYEELQTVVDEWVEAAMALGEKDLRVMDMLIQLQRSSAAVG